MGPSGEFQTTEKNMVRLGGMGARSRIKAGVRGGRGGKGRGRVGWAVGVGDEGIDFAGGAGGGEESHTEAADVVNDVAAKRKRKRSSSRSKVGVLGKDRPVWKSDGQDDDKVS